MKGIKANARIRVEQDVDLVLKNMKLKLPGQPHDEVLMVTDSRYKNYKANEGRIILKDGLLFRKTFGETGSVKYYQTPILKQLVKKSSPQLAWRSWKTPRNCQNNNCLQGKVLISTNGTINQGVGHVMLAMHQRITNRT